MPSPLRSSDRKKSGSDELGSSDFRRKKLKREDGAKEWTGKPSELCERVKPDLETIHTKRKTMNSSNYTSFLKIQLRNAKLSGCSGVSTGGGSQLLPRSTNDMSEGGTRSHEVQKSLQFLLKRNILKLCQILQFPEDARVMVGRFLKYVVDKHEVNRQRGTKLEAFQISLCWNAASLLKCKIDKKESLQLAKQHLLFSCSVEEVSDMYSKLRKLRKMFVVDVANAKEIEFSKLSVSAIVDTMKDKEKPQKSPIEEKVEHKLEKRMKKLLSKQQKEIDEFHRIWRERRVQLLEQYKAALLSSRHSISSDKLNKLKRLDDELGEKIEEHKYQREKSLGDLKAQHMAKKTKEIEKKARWLEEMKSSRRVEPSYIMPCDGMILDYPIQNATICPSPDHKTGLVNSVTFRRPSIDYCRKLSSLHRSVNASEYNIVAEQPSSEGQLPNGPVSTVEEVLESAGMKFVGGQLGSDNDSDNNIIAKLPSDEEQLPNEPLPSLEEVKKNAGNDSEGNIVARPLSSEERFCNVPTSSVEKVSKSAGIELVGGLHGSGDASQDNFVTTPTSSEVQFPLGPSTSVKEVTKSASIELSLQRERPQSRTCSQTENTEAPSQNEQLRTEVGESDQTVHELILTNPSEQQQQPPSADIPVDKNQPTSASMSPSRGDDHVLILANPSDHPQLQPFANTLVGMNRPTSSSPSPSPGSERGLILENPSEQQSQCLPFRADTNQRHPVAASAVEQTPRREERFSINAEVSQQSQCLPFRVDTNQHHPVPASVVEQTPRREEQFSINAEVSQQSQCIPFRVDTNHPVPASVGDLAPLRERHIVTLNAEAPTQYVNSQLLSNQSALGHVFSSTCFSTPVGHVPDLRAASNDNHQLVVGTPVLPNQVNSPTQWGTAPSISSSMGDSRSNPMLQGPRQAAPQITAQRLTSNPLYNEYQRLSRESDSLVKSHEIMKLQLRSDCEKELAEIRKKYELKLQDAEAAFIMKKKELDITSTTVWMHGLYAVSFQGMAQYKSTIKLPQDVSSNLTQQVRRSHPQAQPTLSSTILTSPISVLSACNRQNSPQFIRTVTPPQPNFLNNGMQAPPLLQDFRSMHPFSATSSVSALQRALPHLESRRLPGHQPVHFGVGLQSSVRGDFPSLENPSSSRSAFVSYLQNQIGTCPSNFSPSVPAAGSNLGLLPQFMAANNGGSQGTDTVQSGATPGLICLSDDE